MRVLLAIDGSLSSGAASQLVGSLTWPEGSVIKVIGIVEPLVEVPAPLAGPSPVPDLVGQDLERVLEGVVASLAKPTLIVSRTILEGRPGTLIVEAAADFRAELVVVGSRGLGPLGSMLLGSVSAEVVDHAPCPVLVVRRPTAEAVLVAVDASPSARAAVAFLKSTRILGRRRVEVLSVAPDPGPPGTYQLAGISDRPFDSFDARVLEDRRRAEAIAADAGQRLRDIGCDVRWSISAGHAAHEIIEAAACFGSGLIVMGSRGHTGLARLVLGSVARNVLLHTSASVLIVREPVRQESPERAEAPGRAVPVTTGLA